ncbi:MAG: hypothetical protein DWQ34_18840 [Planctomycetota bacterium]|nr:MAG: hypothetical protein DWQ34_18840 [Planctomycetota bacterium]REK21563.1 MAG: hypothetical protein DWQ41_21080 [Planctomycetota bacterium]REK39883.1 MAG: hypothetical protein DWQ45_01015 [Planctomycetota bacterium]
MNSPPALAWQDHAVIIAYITGMIALGAWLSRKQQTDEDYFLGGRSMPWFAVGLSVIASLLSSLTYLSEPGEVWKSGITHQFGKLIAIPLEMLFVFLVCVPFLMRFRYTSAYEYLGDRFGPRTRLLGAVLFLLLVVQWMGFVVLASSRALAAVSGMPLWLVIMTVGIAATLYTALGGLRAVIWTDVVQVILLIGGGLFTIGYVAVTTGTGLTEWLSVTQDYLLKTDQDDPMPIFSFDPTVRATVITVGVNMFTWHVCTHIANQMTVQRYFSTSDVRAARRSFITAALVGVGLNLMLMVVGLALVYFYFGRGQMTELAGAVPAADNGNPRYDLIFPTFSVLQLPPGLGGAILAALLAAAMSSIDSGVNSMATVISTEIDLLRGRPASDETRPATSHVGRGRAMTVVFGLFITVAAFGLNFLPNEWGIIDAMPRTFNAITGPIGGLFFIGMFVRKADARAAVLGALCGMITSLGIGYSEQIGKLIGSPWPALSFTWVMPCSLAVTVLAGWLFSLFGYPKELRDPRLTWRG